MATWIAHMRIAEHFMREYSELNNEEFLVGNIGPDCGVPNEDWSAFTPGKEITHWYVKVGTDIDAEAFRDRYKNVRDKRYPFYLGYYCHLLADIEWGKLCRRKLAESPQGEGMAADKDFISAMKKDWYGQDHLFLRKHPDSVFYTMFAGIEIFDNIYLDYFPCDAFTRQIRHITGFYLSAVEDADRAFPYLSTEEMDGIVSETIDVIVKTIFE